MSIWRTNRFWFVSLEHTLFLDFLKLFVNMRLAASFAGKINAFFGPTDQKLWMFEVSRRSLGRAGMCCSQWERVDHLSKKWRAGRKKISTKMGTARQVQVSTRGQRATAGPRTRAGRRPAVFLSFPPQNSTSILGLKFDLSWFAFMVGLVSITSIWLFMFFHCAFKASNLLEEDISSKYGNWIQLNIVDVFSLFLSSFLS
jgi:hypothetical protein